MKTSKEIDEYNDFLLEIIMNRYDLEWKRTYQIESKATSLVGFIGVIFSIMIISLTSTSKPSTFMDLFLLNCNIIFLLSSLIFGVCVLYLKNRWFLNANRFLNKYNDQNHIPKYSMVQNLCQSFKKGIKDNKDQNDSQAEFLLYSYISFTLGIIFMLIFVYSHLFI